jgi:hypothetical protein
VGVAAGRVAADLGTDPVAVWRQLITGDDARTATAIARRVGIFTRLARSSPGAELARLDEEPLAERVTATSLPSSPPSGEAADLDNRHRFVRYLLTTRPRPSRQSSWRSS